MPIIKNMLFTSGANVNPVDLRCQLNFQPDEAIVRQITFSSTVLSAGIYLLWCSLTNDYIGAFHNRTNGTITFPNMRIPIKSGVPNNLQFVIELAGTPGPVAGLNGQWAVQIDFIKY